MTEEIQKENESIKNSFIEIVKNIPDIAEKGEIKGGLIIVECEKGIFYQQTNISSLKVIECMAYARRPKEAQ